MKLFLHRNAFISLLAFGLVVLNVWLLIQQKTIKRLNENINELYRLEAEIVDVLHEESETLSTRLMTLEESSALTNHNLEVLIGRVDVLDDAVHGSEKRKARIQNVIGAIKSMLPRGGNWLPGCPKTPSAGELFLIANAIVDNADYYAVPASLIAAVIRQESAFCNDAVSKAGARGYMQLMPETAAQVAADVAVKTRKTLRIWRGIDNIELGTAYLSEQLMDFNGDIALAVAAYNAGPNHVKKVQAGEVASFHAETANYMEVVPKLQEEFKKLGLQ